MAQETQPGPFSGPVNELLTRSFGQSLNGIEVARGEDEKNRGLGAKAHTIGHKISLGAGITEDPSDAASMEVLAHEVSHALAGGGSGEELLSSRAGGDPGEAAADAAGGAFRDYVDGDAKGAAPKLAPAHGGRAAIHRSEAGEHSSAVDNAALTLEQSGQHVDQRVASMAAEPIRLGNGLLVSPGDLSAMMGDFYGAYDPDPQHPNDPSKQHFNPAKSYELLNNADIDEMREILEHIHQERATVEKVQAGGAVGPDGQPLKFHATPSAEFQHITQHRKTETDEDGTIKGYNFMELAQHNSAHFSKATTEGTDNNMGAYNSFHEMAMQAAASGKPEDIVRARGLEASAQHFLVDRFAGGHQFDKDSLVEHGQIDTVAGKGLSGGIPGNVISRMNHNEWNGKGVDVHDSNSPETWHAMGDEHWADEDNADNRVHAAQATMDSYAQLQAAMDHKGQSDAQVHDEVPVFNQKFQKGIEAKAAHTSLWDVLCAEKDEVVDGLSGAGRSAQGWADVKLNDWDPDLSLRPQQAWNSAKRAGGELWDGAKHVGGELWDGAQGVAGAAHGLWDGAKGEVAGAAHGLWDGAKGEVAGAAHGLWDGAKGGAKALWDWL